VPALATAPSLADLGKLLSGITDGPTATAAKGKLETLVGSLKSAAGSAPAAGGLGELGKLAGQAATKLGVSPEVMQQITALLANPAVKDAIGPVLEQLQSLLK